MKAKSSTLLFSMVCAVAVATGVAQAQANSLWVKAGNSEQSMFADKIARNIGDILTIVVDENTTATQNADLLTRDEYQGGAGIGIALNSFLNQFLQAAPKWFGMATGIPVNDGDVTIPTLDVAATGEWNAGGRSSNVLTVTNRTAVTVVDVLPNGNLVVEGAKIIRTNNEDQYAYMRGIVRPVDIAADNTIPSTKIADAQVEFIPSGQLTEAQKKGWLLRAWEKVKPF
ncbi:MAG: flagellar basal body L-ring protein FlgH [Verrucomicrobiota bacterium]